jgi:alpha-L-fucosidase
MIDALAQRLVQVRPSERQLRWQRMGMNAFFHFGINTFTGREWGTGREDPAAFDPPSVDADQWCRAVKRAGIRGCILTAKHHDGFCLWDTNQTRHSAMYSPFGKDVVRLLADACRRHDLKLGLYLSPWDRREPSYGSGKAYDDFFCAQLAELLTGYGPLFELWFDGACGEGPNGRVQRYDWERIYALIRRHQPDACIAVCGPDVRWCGNEAGAWRESEWSAVPASLRDCEKIQAASQRSDGARFRSRGIRSGDMDLGSRRVMAKAGEWAWYPAEVNASIRPGWFYHASEDEQLKSADWLLDLYEHTVGGNAVLLLNVPPAPDGRIHAFDEARLAELGERIRARYGENLAQGARIEASAEAAGHEARHALTEDESFWMPEDGCEAAELCVRLPQPREISRVVLEEQVTMSQRVERFELAAGLGGEERTIYSGTTIGLRRICSFPTVPADRVTLRILESRVAPTIRHFALY